MTKKRTINELRQTKDSVYKHPEGHVKIHGDMQSDKFYSIIKDITKDTPNDSMLGEKIRHMIWDIEKENEKGEH